MGKPGKHYVTWKGPVTEDLYNLYNPMYMECPEKTNPWGQKADLEVGVGFAMVMSFIWRWYKSSRIDYGDACMYLQKYEKPLNCSL